MKRLPASQLRKLVREERPEYERFLDRLFSRQFKQPAIFSPWRVVALHTVSTAATLICWPPAMDNPLPGLVFAWAMSLGTTMALYSFVPKGWLP